MKTATHLRVHCALLGCAMEDSDVFVKPDDEFVGEGELQGTRIRYEQPLYLLTGV